MKRTIRPILAAVALAAGVLTVLLAGCATHPPTAWERQVFNIVTNPPVIQVTTNVIPVTIWRTNEVAVTLTNAVGVTEYRTNVTVIPLTTYTTNFATVTNQPESYVFTPGAGAAAYRQVGTEVGNVFGVGGIVGTGLGVLFSLWGYIRSRKSYLTAANIAQTVETMREFIKSLPNGAVIDGELVNWMQQNQANAGVLQSVINLIAREVSNPDAQVAARNITAVLEQLRAIGTNPATKA